MKFRELVFIFFSFLLLFHLWKKLRHFFIVSPRYFFSCDQTCHFPSHDIIIVPLYLFVFNFSAGTINPYEHGEVFVVDDGKECDLDLVRFIILAIQLGDYGYFSRVRSEPHKVDGLAFLLDLRFSLTDF